MHLDVPNLAAPPNVQRPGPVGEALTGPYRPQVTGVDRLPEGHEPRRRGHVGPNAGHAFGQGRVDAAVQVAEGLQVSFVHLQNGGYLGFVDGLVLEPQRAVEARTFENAPVELWHAAIVCEDTVVEMVAYLPGYLSPPSGFAELAEKMADYRALHLPPQPTLTSQLEAWADLPEGAHLVASFEAGMAAVRLAAEKKAKSLVWYSPFARVDAALQARLEALAWALRQGGVAGFVRVAAPLLFGSLMLERGGELIEAWAAGLDAAGLESWLEGLLQAGDERKWLRTLKDVPVLSVVGSEDACTPMRYAHDVTEWIPDLRGILVTLEGAGHFGFWENPREAVSLGRGFIERYREFLEGPAEWQDDEEETPPPLRFEPEAPQ